LSVVPETSDEWKATVQQVALGSLAELPRLREALGVAVEPTTIAGVKAFIVTPKVIPARNRDRVLLHLHGGIRVFNPGEAGRPSPHTHSPSFRL
jgi:acetyl esterase/lipase